MRMQNLSERITKICCVRPQNSSPNRSTATIT